MQCGDCTSAAVVTRIQCSIIADFSLCKHITPPSQPNEKKNSTHIHIISFSFAREYATSIPASHSKAQARARTFIVNWFLTTLFCVVMVVVVRPTFSIFSFQCHKPTLPQSVSRPFDQPSSQPALREKLHSGISADAQWTKCKLFVCAVLGELKSFFTLIRTMLLCIFAQYLTDCQIQLGLKIIAIELNLPIRSQLSCALLPTTFRTIRPWSPRLSFAGVASSRGTSSKMYQLRACKHLWIHYELTGHVLDLTVS